MIHEIENWNKEKEEGIIKRREVKARIRSHEESLKEEESRKLNNSALTTTTKGDRPGTSGSLSASLGNADPPNEGDEAKPVEKIIEEEKPDTDSDDEYQDIDIKKKLKDFKKANTG